MKTSKGAEEAVKKLVNEINNLSGVLHSLDNVVERLEAENARFDPSCQIHQIHACYETLSKVEQQFDKAVPKAPLSNWEKLNGR
jgi:exonuclease VII small subunit